MMSVRIARRLPTQFRATASKTYSTETRPAVQAEKQEEYEKQLKDFKTLRNIQRKPRVKKPQRGPFLKNLFTGQFDTEILTYPELSKEEVDNLEKRLPQIEQLVDLPHMCDVKTFSDKKFRQNLSDVQCIGLQASQFMGGSECTNGESFRILEALCKHRLRENILYNEQLGVQLLVKFGDQFLKTKYLDPVLRGEKVTALCLTEHNLDDINAVKTKAEESVDKKKWTLNGEKAWVVNGNSADYLLVLAVTKTSMVGPFKTSSVTLFLVDKEFGGVYCTKCDNPSDVCDVRFENTEVPAQNVIGEVHFAEKVLKEIVTDFRLASAVPCLSLTRKIINDLNKYVVDISTKDNELYQTDLVRESLADLVVRLYTMESMVYLTTGLMDTYQDQDHELESAIVKVFSSENLMGSAAKCLNIVGLASMDHSNWSKELYHESLNYVTLQEPNDGLKTTIALLGLQYAGEKLEQKIKKIRNPLHHGAFILRRIFSNSRNVEDNPKLDLRLGDYLHPTSSEGALALEYCVKRFEYAVETLLTHHGLQVMNKHMDLRRIAEIITDIYGMVAVLGRSSRAYCIGLQHAQFEMVLANTFCIKAKERVRDNVKEIVHGHFVTNDENCRVVSKRLTKFNGYFPVHPLARNF